MKILVAYASAHGSTAEIADRIAATIRAAGIRVEATPVTDAADVDANDAFVVGSAVFGGRWMDQAVAFVERHADVLSSRPTWLFSSGPTGKTATKYQPQETKEVAAIVRLVRPREHRIFAGSWRRSNAELVERPFVERFVAKHLIPEGDFRDWDAIERWAREIARELRSVAARH